MKKWKPPALDVADLPQVQTDGADNLCGERPAHHGSKRREAKLGSPALLVGIVS
jgi:hypothetical protein